MKKFQYKLQTVLGLQSKLEKQAKMIYRKKQKYLQEQEMQLENDQNQKKAYEDRKRKLFQNTFIPQQMRTYEIVIQDMKEKVIAQTKKVKEAENEAEKARKKMEQAMQERKIQEKLKEKAWEMYQKEWELAQQKEIDEQVSFQYDKIGGEKNNGESRKSI